MRTMLGVCALLMVGSLAGPAFAQNISVDEVVVTGSRLSEYDPLRTPYITVRKRADNLVTTVTVTCDTRDLSQRQQELRTTLRNMIRTAAAAGVELGLGDEIIGRFDDTMLDAVIKPDKRADTSAATVVVKTKVAATDTFDTATGRIKAFVDKTAKVGRTEMLLDDEWNLTLIGPQKHHAEVVATVAEDARRTAAAFGTDYSAAVENLQLPVSWYQAGPLELALYIPYKLTVSAPGR